MAPFESGRLPGNSVLDHLPALRAFARILAGDPARADDLVRETLTTAIADIDGLDPGTNLRAWLFTIERNAFYRSPREHRHTESAERARASETAAPAMTLALSQKGRGRDVMEGIESLSPRYREVLVLVAMLGESHESCAEICGCSVGTVRSRLSRARDLVRNRYGERSI